MVLDVLYLLPLLLRIVFSFFLTCGDFESFLLLDFRSSMWAKTSKYVVTFITTLLSTVVYLLKLFVAFNEVLKVWINVRYSSIIVYYWVIILFVKKIAFHTEKNSLEL